MALPNINTVLAAPLIKWIHSVGTQCEPNVSWFVGKVLMVLIKILPLVSIDWMAKLAIIFVLI